VAADLPDPDRIREQSLEILLVEDNDDHVELVRHALTADTDWTVHRAGLLEEASASLDDARFDLVILDYQLPDGDGLELLDDLRSRNRQDPVLFLTGKGSEDVAMQAIQNGALDYLVKGPGLVDRLEERCVEALRGWAKVGPLVADHSPSEEIGQGTLESELAALIDDPIVGAVAWSQATGTVGVELPDHVDAKRVASVIRGVHESLGNLRDIDLEPRRWATVAQTDKQLLALSVAPGPILVGLLLKSSTGSLIGMRRAQEAARRLWEAA